MANVKVLTEAAIQAAKDAFDAAVAKLGVGAVLDPEDDAGAVSGKAVADFFNDFFVEEGEPFEEA